MFLDQPDFWVPMKNCGATEEEVPCKTKQNNEKKNGLEPSPGGSQSQSKGSEKHLTKNA